MNQIKDRVFFDEYKGKEILICKFSNLKGEEIIETIHQLSDTIQNSGKTDILLLVDTTNSPIGPKTMDAFKKIAPILKPSLQKAAILGITGIKKPFLKVVVSVSKMDVKPFKTEEEAKEYITQ
ncbi:MAG: hypothetical protein GY870_01265 [archaeon]|nr:hypothetical protein [archaeon]